MFTQRKIAILPNIVKGEITKLKIHAHADRTKEEKKMSPKSLLAHEKSM